MVHNFVCSIISQELNVSFSTIIIPETMKKLLVEDETVLEMISKLNLIISTCTLPLPELIKELQTHLRYMIMGMPVSCQSSIVNIIVDGSPQASIYMHFSRLIRTALPLLPSYGVTSMLWSMKAVIPLVERWLKARCCLWASMFYSTIFSRTQPIYFRYYQLLRWPTPPGTRLTWSKIQDHWL